MSFPKLGYQSSSEWNDYFKRREQQQRTGKSLTERRLEYVERMQATGKEPLSFTRWLPLKDEL